MSPLGSFGTYLPTFGQLKAGAFTGLACSTAYFAREAKQANAAKVAAETNVQGQIDDAVGAAMAPVNAALDGVLGVNASEKIRSLKGLVGTLEGQHVNALALVRQEAERAQAEAVRAAEARQADELQRLQEDRQRLTLALGKAQAELKGFKAGSAELKQAYHLAARACEQANNAITASTHAAVAGVSVDGDDSH